MTLYEGRSYAEKRAPGDHQSMGCIHGTNRIGVNAILDAISFCHLVGTTPGNMK